MTHQYTITGMTCNGCVTKARSALLGLGDITSAEVQLDAPQATIQMQKHIPLAVLQQALHKAGNYTISEAGTMHHTTEEKPASWLGTYKPVLLIGAYITGISLLLQFFNTTFDLSDWMRHFMAGFFLAFSFFKMLDVKAFAESYASYDIIAKRFIAWGYIYPFIELSLGIAYLLDLSPMVLNSITLIVMGVGIIGVLQSVLNKRKIQCACLGAVFNLPMSSITIIEDALMILMSAGMIISML
jgi:copper chaperone CopZ